jgi:hypothetical protein
MEKTVNLMDSPQDGKVQRMRGFAFETVSADFGDDNPSLFRQFLKES